MVADVIAELCALLGIDSPTEQQEFSLYCIVQGDAFTMPLASDEYILDVTTELLKSAQPFYLIFCRSVWHFQLRREPAPTPLYIEVLFNQVAPDYLEGLLLELPGGGAPSPDVVRDMARIAALLHRAADLNHVPAMKEIKFLLPKPALGIRELRPAQWVALVQSAWPSIAGLGPAQVKAQFLSVLASWSLFGSSFFAVKRVWAEEAAAAAAAATAGSSVGGGMNGSAAAIGGSQANLGPGGALSGSSASLMNGGSSAGGGAAADEANPMWRELILALNRRGILFLDPNTHETLQHWPFMEVISTRKVSKREIESLHWQSVLIRSVSLIAGSIRGRCPVPGHEGGQSDAAACHSRADGAGARDFAAGAAVHHDGAGRPASRSARLERLARSDRTESAHACAT